MLLKKKIFCEGEFPKNIKKNRQQLKVIFELQNLVCESSLAG